MPKAVLGLAPSVGCKRENRLRFLADRTPILHRSPGDAAGCGTTFLRNDTRNGDARSSSMNYLDRTFLPRIDLAREADFAVGALQVRPSRCEVEAGGVRLVLQRRVMQVLVALAHPSAEVVSQDELISRCWGGLAVGEDAVGR